MKIKELIEHLEKDAEKYGNYDIRDLSLSSRNQIEDKYEFYNTIEPKFGKSKFNKFTTKVLASKSVLPLRNDLIEFLQEQTINEEIMHVKIEFENKEIHYDSIDGKIYLYEEEVENLE